MSSTAAGALEGKSAIVTGGGAGLGLVYAETLAREGASVTIADIDEDRARSAAQSLADAGAAAIGLCADVSNDADVRQMVVGAEAAFGRVDILVNNAGLARGQWSLCIDLESEDWLRLFAVNVVGAVTCARACRPLMAAQGGGVIVNQSSMAAYSVLKTAYGVSKLAMSGLTVALATELAPDGIRVNGIAPGMMSGRVPDDVIAETLARQLITRRGGSDDLVGALMFLCTEASSFMTGQTLIIDGGITRRA
jgi:NAD(P)-dependent dehydrogenase (short-subunit alcohol dehydrogenase family)